MDNLHIILFAIIGLFVVKLLYDNTYTDDNIKEFIANIRPDYTIYDNAQPLYYNIPPDGWYASRGLLPWWNTTRHTRNMSYDIRGDVRY